MFNTPSFNEPRYITGARALVELSNTMQYRRNTKRKRSSPATARKRSRRPAARRAYIPKIRRRRMRKSSSCVSRWNKNKRSIVNPKFAICKTKETSLFATAISGGSLFYNCLTDIPFGTSLNDQRTRNNIFCKGFSLNMLIQPETGCNMPTWMRIALVVQRGPYVSSGISNVEFFQGTKSTDNFQNQGIINEGWQNRTNSINSLKYAVIWSKTIQFAPLLEAGATSIQSNLNARQYMSTYIKYPKNIVYDDSLDNVSESSNVFLVYWFDDDFRLPGAASTTTHKIMGRIITKFVDVPR